MGRAEGVSAIFDGVVFADVAGGFVRLAATRAGFAGASPDPARWAAATGVAFAALVDRRVSVRAVSTGGRAARADVDTALPAGLVAAAEAFVAAVDFAGPAAGRVEATVERAPVGREAVAVFGGGTTERLRSAALVLATGFVGAFVLAAVRAGGAAAFARDGLAGAAAFAVVRLPRDGSVADVRSGAPPDRDLVAAGAAAAVDPRAVETDRARPVAGFGGTSKDRLGARVPFRPPPIARAGDVALPMGVAAVFDVGLAAALVAGRVA